MKQKSKRKERWVTLQWRIEPRTFGYGFPDSLLKGLSKRYASRAIQYDLRFQITESLNELVHMPAGVTLLSAFWGGICPSIFVIVKGTSRYAGFADQQSSRQVHCEVTKGCIVTSRR
jgi:hypothetical protein